MKRPLFVYGGRNYYIAIIIVSTYPLRSRPLPWKSKIKGKLDIGVIWYFSSSRVFFFTSVQYINSNNSKCIVFRMLSSASNSQTLSSEVFLLRPIIRWCWYVIIMMYLSIIHIKTFQPWDFQSETMYDKTFMKK